MPILCAIISTSRTTSSLSIRLYRVFFIGHRPFSPLCLYNTPTSKTCQVPYINIHTKYIIYFSNRKDNYGLIFPGISVIITQHMDRYRSGHNGPDSKSGSPHGLVGSNPTVSVCKVMHRFISMHDFFVCAKKLYTSLCSTSLVYSLCICIKKSS